MQYSLLEEAANKLIITEHGEDITRHMWIVSHPSQCHRSCHQWDSTTPQKVVARVNEPNECEVPTLALGI